MSAKEALPLVKPLIERLDAEGSLFFCADEASQRRREIARLLAETEAEYELEWWVMALEEVRAGAGSEGELQEKVARAREWLGKNAPRRGEVVKS